MNQNNNIIGYDSQTGQPIYGNQNTSAQQPTQPQMNTGYTQRPTQPQSHKKSKKGLAIIAVLVIIIIAGIVLFGNQSKKETTNNEQSNNSGVENNNEQKNNNSTGSVEAGTNTTYDENGAFLFSIEDVFTITGRGTVVTGNVQRGKLKVGDVVPVHLQYGDLTINANVKIVSASDVKAGGKFIDLDQATANKLLYLSLLEKDQPIAQTIMNKNVATTIEE